jgi:hypothetical protein
MARLVSDIGVEQRKQTSHARKAYLYREMAAAITMGATNLIAGFPKYIPRGHTAEWYLDRAERAEQVSTSAGEMADLLFDMEQRNRLEAMTPHAVWRRLTGDERLQGEEFPPGIGRGILDTLAYWIDSIGRDLPYTAEKLTTEQRQWCQRFIRTHMEALIEAFDGRGPWTK